jgi:purine-cytosine permease-like protein
MMSYEKKQSTLDISREYMGNIGNYFIAILLLASTFAWFVTQTTSASTSITGLLSLNEDPNIDQFFQVSVFLGILSTFFCMGGMALLRKLSTFCFPVLVIAFFVVLYTLPRNSAYENTNPLSLYGLALVLATNLGITADLPTFFRHSHSWGASIRALTIVQLASLTLGLCSLALGPIISGVFEIDHAAVVSSGNHILRGTIIGFILLSVVCANVANVYAASVGWELVAPKALVGRKELFILGLGLTTIFILITGLFSLEFLLDFSDDSLVNLSLVLLFGYIISRLQKSPPRFFEQMTYFSAWLFATVVNFFQALAVMLSGYTSIAVSTAVIIGVLLFAFLGKMCFKMRVSRL